MPTSERQVETPISRRHGEIADFGGRFAIVGVWFLVIIVFSALRPDSFFTVANFQTIFSSQAVLLVLTLGLLVSLTAGEFDLSAAGAFGFAFVLVGYFDIIRDWPIGWAVLVALMSGVGVGLLNSALIVGFRLQSIVVTLATGTLLIGASHAVNNRTVGGVSEHLVSAVRHEIFGIQSGFYYALAITMLTWYAFSYTPIGRYLYFVGASHSVARLSGLRVNGIRIGSLMTTSFVAAFAGVMLAGNLGSSDPNIAPTYLLPAFAAAFLGATAIVPGRFNPWGTFVAVYFLSTGITGLALVGLSGWINDVFYGASLVLAVLFSEVLRRRAVFRASS